MIVEILTCTLSFVGLILTARNGIKLKRLEFQLYAERKDFDERLSIIQETSSALSERCNSTKSAPKEKLRELMLRAVVYAKSDDERVQITKFYQAAIDRHSSAAELAEGFCAISKILHRKNPRLPFSPILRS